MHDEKHVTPWRSPPDFGRERRYCKWNAGFDFREAWRVVHGCSVETGHWVREMEFLIRNSTFARISGRERINCFFWRDGFGQRRSRRCRTVAPMAKLASPHLFHWGGEDSSVLVVTRRAIGATLSLIPPRISSPHC